MKKSNKRREFHSNYMADSNRKLKIIKYDLNEFFNSTLIIQIEFNFVVSIFKKNN
jgi:hypothetical protein